MPHIFAIREQSFELQYLLTKNEGHHDRENAQRFLPHFRG